MSKHKHRTHIHALWRWFTSNRMELAETACIAIIGIAFFLTVQKNFAYQRNFAAQFYIVYEGVGLHPSAPQPTKIELVRIISSIEQEVLESSSISSSSQVSSQKRPVVVSSVSSVHNESTPATVAVVVPVTEQVVPEHASFSVSGDQLHAAAAEEDFPPFMHSSNPVARVPNWGAMRTPEEWERPFSQMTEEDFVRIPAYNMSVLTVPTATYMADLTNSSNISALTAKLYYSTRFFGSYDLDAGEFTGIHPGVDLKLARGTPVGAIGGGRVYAVSTDMNLGIHVIIEHRIPGDGTYFSMYGHLDQAWVQAGDSVTPGQGVGRVGLTGNTSVPHVHLQVDKDTGKRPFVRYWPFSLPSAAQAVQFTVNPITFIAEHR